MNAYSNDCPAQDELFPQEVEIVIKPNGDVLVADECDELRSLEDALGHRADASPNAG